MNLLDPVQLDQFINAVADRRPALVVVDTLSRCIVGANENDTATMTHAVDACDRIRTTLNTTVLILHHMNKGGLQDRGSTVLPGALDSQFFLRPKTKRAVTDDGEAYAATLPGRIRLIHAKQKDLDQGSEIELVKEVVKLEGLHEANGLPVTSCVWLIADDFDDAQLDKQIIDKVRESPGIRKDRVSKNVGVRKQVASAAIKALIDSGQLVDSEGLRLPS